MSEVLVSIITPVYNAEKFIANTVDSVLAQTVDKWELILAENGSKDGTKKVLEELRQKDSRIKVMYLGDNVGAAKARNAGIKKASGRYIAFLDADDLWNENKLKDQIRFMEKKNAAFSFTGYEFGTEAAEPTGKIVHVPESLTYRQALKNTTIFTSTVMFDTRKIAKEELFMPAIKSEDTALWWQILRSGKKAYGLNKNLVLYRRPAKSLSSNKLEAVRRIWYLYRKWEKLNVFQSAWYFIHWGARAVKRRI